MSEGTTGNTAAVLDRAIADYAETCECWGLAMGRSSGDTLQELTAKRTADREATVAAFRALIAERDAASVALAAAEAENERLRPIVDLAYRRQLLDDDAASADLSRALVLWAALGRGGTEGEGA